ncbi:BgTH12-01898 [Blumeria graminis f. sp. triticale]|uniref:BgTH12-01898 n=1 Tax=Blumeria graminis f. sp. triticale TaxID=1689686 RepID=A0A9W4CZN9_BLUGR|nr:BgTH12-01898 [Blumeria graminis f. sp. triticale]
MFSYVMAFIVVSETQNTQLFLQIWSNVISFPYGLSLNLAIVGNISQITHKMSFMLNTRQSSLKSLKLHTSTHFVPPNLPNLLSPTLERP